MTDATLFTAGFNDNSKKIVPELSDDWTISPRGAVKRESIRISSANLNIAFDISIRDFLSFSLDKRLTLVANQIQGMYIFDKHRKIHTSDEYFEILDEIEMNQVSEIKKAELVIGNKYKIENGDIGIYFGTKFISRVNPKDIGTDTVKPIKKVHLFNVTQKKQRFASGGIGFLNSKVIEQVDRNVLSLSDIEDKLKNFNNVNPTFAYFEDYKTVNPTYDYISVDTDKIEPIVARDESKRYFVGHNSVYNIETSKRCKMNLGSKITGVKIDDQDNANTAYYYNGYVHGVKVDKAYRIGLK